ncbi:MAG TPA: FkbM family methyltransferase, partial [Candidatus Acidoferrales bacterium]|nr:FkbM family methyltransferase [Candidatus Acidoferrales bacterium]
VGPPLRRLARRAIPPNTHLWFRISDGLGKGMWAFLDPRFETIYADGAYEAPLQRALSSHLHAGSVFYDVGAHIGIVSMFGARLVGENGRVFAFEADGDNAGRIQENLRRNKLDQVTVVPEAVWSSTGRLRFGRASAHSSRNQGAVATDSAAAGENTVEVNAISLDEFAKEHPSPTLIKIDVEGAEADVLRGGVQVFAQQKPVLICEVHHARAAQDVTQWLRERDYAFEWLEDSPNLPRHLVATWAG